MVIFCYNREQEININAVYSTMNKNPTDFENEHTIDAPDTESKSELFDETLSSSDETTSTITASTISMQLPSSDEIEAAPESELAKVEQEYNADQIQVLKGLEGVRHRPAMYIGSTAESGLHHLVYEIVDNAIDESMAGYCKQITVELRTDGSVAVSDDGRGIPVDPMSDYDNTSALEIIMTTLHAGGKFTGGAYKVSGGLHGVGASVVNALSSKFVVEVRRDNKVWRLECSKGIVVRPVEVIGKSTTTGTKVMFWPDETVFDSSEFKYSILSHRLRELAYLNAGLQIKLVDHRDDTQDVFKFKGGLKEYVSWINRNDIAGHQPVHFVKELKIDDQNSYRVEVAIQYNEGYKENVIGFANNIRTKDGGTHIEGFKSALTRTINAYGQRQNMFKPNEKVLQGEDVREGLTAIVSVWLEHPQFEGQTKGALGNSEVKGIVQQVVNDCLSTHFDENPAVAKKIFQKAQGAQRARDAARRAKEIERKKSGLNSSLPGKLADCSDRNRDRCELFIVEGASAGGNAKQGRDSKFQAVLAIKGKILNVEKATLNRTLNNQEVRDLIAAIGSGIDQNQQIENLRYSKVIVLTDADVDGSHINILLLTFFFRHMDELLKNGRIYIAKNPLYRIRKGKNDKYYVMTEEERDQILNKIGHNGSEVTRFKGLAEMQPEELWETSMNPSKRTLIKVSVEDALEAEDVIQLMGDDVTIRRKFISEYAKRVRNLDI